MRSRSGLGWVPGVLARRVGAQRGVLAVAATLVVGTTTVVGAAALTMTVAQDGAPGAAVAQADPADLTVAVDLQLLTPSSPSALDPHVPRDAAAGVLTHLVDPAPATPQTWLESDLVTTAAPHADPWSGQVGYLATLPAGHLDLVAGRAPAARADAVETAIPAQAAAAYGWAVGDRVTVRAAGSDAATVALDVVGVYQAHDPLHGWSFDSLAGAGFDPEYPLSTSRNVPVAGPLVVTEDTLLGGQVPAARMRVAVTPDLSHLDAAAVRTLGDRLANADTTVTAALQGKASLPRLETRLDTVVAGVLGRLAVTRVAVVVVILVLLLVGGAAALLAARLLAEQRASDVALMFSRGTTRAQQVALAGVEALAVAVVAGGLAAPLAALLVRAVDALNPGSLAVGVGQALAAPSLWLAVAGCAVLLSGLLLVPVLRQDGERAEGPLARPSAGTLGTVARTSAGVVLVGVVAAVAVWQLATRPAVAGRADPVVVVAPALLLLAIALLLTRALPLLARLTDRAAARSSRLVGPLAAWESGRRPERAAQSVLLVTLAVGAAVFALVTLATWRTSQADQAALDVGTPARLGATVDDPFAAADQVHRFATAHGADLRPVSTTNVVVRSQDSGVNARMVATDDPAVLSGRLEPVAGVPGRAGGGDWSGVAAAIGTGPARRALGADLPAGTTTIRLDASLADLRFADQTASLAVVLEDDAGVRAVRHLDVVGAPQTPVEGDGATAHLAATVRDDAEPAAGPVRLVGLTVTTSIDHVDGNDPDYPAQPRATIDVGLTVGALTALDADGTPTPLEIPGVWAARTPLTQADAGGYTVVTQQRVRASVRDGVLHLTRSTTIEDYQAAGGGMVAAPAAAPASGKAKDVVFPGVDGQAPADVPVVVSSNIARRLDLRVGDHVVLDEDAPVPAVVRGIVGYVPGGTSNGVIVRHDLLQAARLALDVPQASVDEWWGTAGAVREAPADTVPGTLRTVTDERGRLRDGPDRASLQAALWLLAAAAVALTGAGAATSVASALHLRRLDLARLQALGVPRRLLVRSVLAEHGLLLGIGVVGGGIVGASTAGLLSARLAVGPDGGPPIPWARLDLPWGWLTALAVVVVGVVGVAVSVTAAAMVRRARAELLRLGADR